VTASETPARLDTCSFIWITTDATELSKKARDLFTNPDNEIFLSPVSVWEIAVKNRLGCLPLPASPERFVPTQRAQHGIESLPLDEESCPSIAIHW
jgi:PIN domain nuclease of toxin-antitoxin system